MSSSPVSSPLVTVNASRITTLLASLIVSVSAGTKYIYSAYSPQLGARLNASHTQLNIIGIAPSVGTAFTSPLLGKIVDSRGPRILLVCAFIFLISGYLGMKFFYDSGLPPEAKSLPNFIFGALILCLFLVGSGGSSAYIASVNTTAKTFSDKVRGSTTGLVISGYGLSPFVFSGLSHLFLAGNTSAFLLLLAFGTSLPMILGIFLVRPIPPPAQENSDLDASQGHLEGSVSPESDPHNSISAPLLDYDFAEGVHSNSAHGISMNNSESYAMEDVPSHRDDEDAIALLSAHRRDFNRDATMMFDQKPNLYGKKLWLSGDFWLLFTILAILSGTGLMYMNNVGTISQLLYAYQNPDYDKVKASGWQAAQVSLISLMSFLGRLSIGLISDFVKNTCNLPRSYLLVVIATLFFVSQLVSARIANVSQLWIASSLVGLAHGSLYSLYPTVCLEWFGMPHFSENWGYLGMSLLAGGNLFSLAFGRNLDVHSEHSQIPSSNNSESEPVQCLQGLDCYVHGIYLTAGATFLSILLCVLAGYREKQRKNSISGISRSKLVGR